MRNRWKSGIKDVLSDGGNITTSAGTTCINTTDDTEGYILVIVQLLLNSGNPWHLSKGHIWPGPWAKSTLPIKSEGRDNTSYIHAHSLSGHHPSPKSSVEHFLWKEFGISMYEVL
jgi:hypothetical protein